MKRDLESINMFIFRLKQFLLHHHQRTPSAEESAYLLNAGDSRISGVTKLC